MLAAERRRRRKKITGKPLNSRTGEDGENNNNKGGGKGSKSAAQLIIESGKGKGKGKRGKIIPKSPALRGGMLGSERGASPPPMSVETASDITRGSTHTRPTHGYQKSRGVLCTTRHV